MDIVEKSNTTLLSIEQNDPKLTHLAVVGRDYTADNTERCFWLHDGADLSRLGNAIANNTHLKSITLRESSGWTRDISSIFEGIQRNVTIKHLHLQSGIGIGVLNEFVSLTQLENLGILECDLRDGVLSKSLAQTITKCPNLKHILIFECKIDDASLRDIALGIRGLSCLEKLHMWNYSSNINSNSIGIEGAVAIGSLSQNISNLKLSSIGFDNESIQIVVNGLIGNDKLKQLDLSGNRIGRSGYESIATLLQNPNSNINKIGLWGMANFADEYASLLAQSLIGNSKLEHLDLSHNKIERSGCESIAALLQSPSCNLISLDLGRCGLGNNGWATVTTIVHSLIGNTKLAELGLSGNRIGRPGCESIAALLQDPNSNINKIDLSNSKIDDDCAVFAQALIGNNKLKCLDLSGNRSITESGWNAFSAILANNSNRTLCSLGKDHRDKDFVPDSLASLLKLNRAVDMEPLFEVDSEDDERNMKALPCVIDWFGRIRGSTQDEEVMKCIKARKLSAIFQFARAMPLKFVPASHFTHPSVVSLIQLKEDRDNALERKYRELQQRNSELEKQVVAKDTEIASMREAKEKSDDVLKAKEDEIKDLYGRLDSIVNVARPKRKFPWD